MRPLILGAACAFLALLNTGCQTPHTFATPDASWKSHIGQLKHTNSKRTLVGEVVVQQRGAQEFQLDYLKGGSFPLISIRQDAEVTRAEGLLAGGRWQGAPDKAPPALRPWLSLRKFFSWAVTASTPSLTFTDGGQRFEFQFQR
jgi:hypothetical protein